MTTRTLTATCIATALTATTLTTTAQAQAACAARDQVISRLETKYGESRQSIGLAPNNGVFEVYASAETGTWTIVMTQPNGVTCLVASGSAFEALAELAVAKGDDA